MQRMTSDRARVTPVKVCGVDWKQRQTVAVMRDGCSVVGWWCCKQEVDGEANKRRAHWSLKADSHMTCLHLQIAAAAAASLNKIHASSPSLLPQQCIKKRRRRHHQHQHHHHHHHHQHHHRGIIIITITRQKQTGPAAETRPPSNTHRGAS